MGIPVAPGDAWECAAAGQIEKLLAQAMTIQRERFVLVAKTHQTLVTGSQAGWPLVCASGVEMASLKCLDGQPGDTRRASATDANHSKVKHVYEYTG